jgi:zinc transport system substrate-binding protein
MMGLTTPSNLLKMVFMISPRGALRARAGAPRGLVPTVLTFAALLLSGCAFGSAGSSSKPHVVAAFYPYAYVAERVAGKYADVTDVTSPGIEPHDLELTPQQVADLSSADLVIYESGFQPSIDKAIQQNPPRAAFDVTGVVPLQPLPDSPAGASNSEKDPHLWLDPTNLVPIARRVANDLGDADPRHASDYTANAHKLVSDLASLDAAYRAGLSHCQRAEFVASHAAFGYLAARYGLTMLAIAGLSPDVEPSAQHLAALQRMITADGLTTVFSERLGTSAYADSLAHDLGLTSAVLDPIEGLSKADPNATYLTLMRGNLAALRKADGCR